MPAGGQLQGFASGAKLRRASWVDAIALRDAWVAPAGKAGRRPDAASVDPGGAATGSAAAAAPGPDARELQRTFRSILRRPSLTARATGGAGDSGSGGAAGDGDLAAAGGTGNGAVTTRYDDEGAADPSVQLQPPSACREVDYWVQADEQRLDREALHGHPRRRGSVSGSSSGSSSDGHADEDEGRDGDTWADVRGPPGHTSVEEAGRAPHPPTVGLASAVAAGIWKGKLRRRRNQAAAGTAGDEPAASEAGRPARGADGGYDTAGDGGDHVMELLPWYSFRLSDALTAFDRLLPLVRPMSGWRVG